jgi:flagellar biosynthesis/type III secretory pathway protein FliH
MAKVIKGTGAPTDDFGAISPDTGFTDGFADTPRKKPAIVSREAYEAGNEARKIHQDADQRAQSVINEAEQKAQAILAQAETEAEQLKTAASEQGFKQGADEAAQKYTAMILEHSKRMDQKEAQVAVQVRQLSLAIAKKIVGKELEFHPDAVVEMAKKHLQSVRQRKEVYLRVAPVDVEQLREHKRELLDQLGRAKEIEIRADDALTQGSMIIETDAGTIDARLETQLQVIERVLMGKGIV